MVDALVESIGDDLDTALLAILRDQAAQLLNQCPILITFRPAISMYRGQLIGMQSRHEVFDRNQAGHYQVRPCARDEAIPFRMGLG